MARICNGIFDDLKSIKKEYALAIKKIDNDSIYESTDKFIFYEIKNTTKYSWRADPFLYEKEGKTFVFYEDYRYALRRGVISCGEIIEKDDSFIVTNQKIILKEPFHMSFPYLFEINDGLYMIPETMAARQLRLYKCVDFPYKWEFEKVLMNNVNYCDTIVTKNALDNNVYVISSDSGVTPIGKIASCYVKNVKYVLDTESKSIDLKSIEYLNEGDIGVRNAGYYNNGIRIGQVCPNGNYGLGMIFYKIMCMSPYKEKEIRMVGTDDIIVTTKSKNELVGTHTYSRTSNYEIIDVGYYNKVKLVARLLYFIKHIQQYISNKVK